MLTFCLALMTSAAAAFEIELPEHYREDLEAKRDREGEVLWRELDRNAIEAVIREFVAAHHQIDGVDLVDFGELLWSREGACDVSRALVSVLGRVGVELSAFEANHVEQKRSWLSRSHMI